MPLEEVQTDLAKQPRMSSIQKHLIPHPTYTRHMTKVQRIWHRSTIVYLNQLPSHPPTLTQHSPTLTNTHQHSPTLTNIHQHSPTLTNIHQHSPTFTNTHQHSLNTHSTLTQHSLNTHSTLTQHSLNTHQHSLNTHSILTQYSLNTHSILTQHINNFRSRINSRGSDISTNREVFEEEKAARLVGK